MFFPENHLFFKKTVVLMTFTAVATIPPVHPDPAQLLTCPREPAEARLCSLPILPAGRSHEDHPQQAKRVN